MAEGQSGYRLLSRIRRRDGNFVWVQFSTQFAEEYIDGCQVAYTVLTNVDDLVRMQKEQSVTYESLPGFVAKYRIDNDLRMTLLEGNTRYMNYFGYDAGDGSGGLHLRNIEANMEAILEQKENLMSGRSVHFVMHVKSRFDQFLWLQVNASCVDWQDGDPVYLVIYIDITDITEMREMQVKLEERTELLKNALEMAEHANNAKSDFLSRMSHEIRTPMNAIIGMTGIAIQEKQDSQKVEDCLHKIDSSSQYLLSLINDILDMSKIESGKMKLENGIFSMKQLLEGVYNLIEPQTMEKNIEFTREFVISEEWVTGDSLHLNQVLINLLGNAVKFTPRGGHIRLKAVQKPAGEGMVKTTFSVRDDGIGVSSENRQRIFRSFEQASDDTSRKYGGTGLGLAISDRLVRMMGGHIALESEENKGSDFSFTLLQTVGKRPVEEDDKLTEGALAGLEGARILLVEDNELNLEIARTILEMQKCQVETALNGQEGVERFCESSEGYYDLILMDIRMPVMDGLEAAKLIRASGRTDARTVPIVAMSANAFEEDVKKIPGKAG